MKTLRLLALSLFATVSAQAATHDLTLPSFGRITLPHVTYRSEIVITNHRNDIQRIDVHFIGREDVGAAGYAETILLRAHESVLKTDFLEKSLFLGFDGVVALRLIAVNHNHVLDPNGNIDARAFVIAERPDGGTSRQEVHPIASSEYLATGATFAGIRHDERAYTNVAIGNMSLSRSELFYIEIGGQRIELWVPPLRVVQIRLPIGPTAARSLTIRPLWAVTLADPPWQSPWAAVVSTVDGLTGDAWTAIRLPAHVGALPP